MEKQMSNANSRPRRKGLAKVLKAVGWLTSPETLPGKVFTAWEKGATSVVEALAHNETYLNFAGRMMERNFRMHARAVRLREDMLRAVRVPTTSEVDELRDGVRRISDEMEALSSQMELVLEALDELKKHKQSNGASGSGTNH
jgi:hypothetical protein